MRTRASASSGVRSVALAMALSVGSTAGLANHSHASVRERQVYDFTQVTVLGIGALSGQNVNTPVPGFEILLMKDGQVVYHRAFGVWTLNRLANADSSTKTISGVIIASLLEDSAVPFTLDSRLSDFLPEFNVPIKRNITIRQCFAHTSGMDTGSPAQSDASITLRQAATQIAAQTLSFLPGTTFSYGGASMHAAGAAAEIAGSAPWNTLFRQRLAQPLGLIRTTYTLTSPDNPRIAGGCESTATEFARMMEMLRTGGVYQSPSGPVRVLNQSSVDQIFTRQTPVGVPIANTPLTGVSDYGIGVWLDQRDAQGRLIGAIAGGARGFCSWIDFDDGMVGAIATDLTQFSNIEQLQYLIRDAAQQAVRAGAFCFADFDRSGQSTIDDVFVFLNAWFAGDPRTDVDQTPGVGIDDFFVFIDGWFDGCP